MCGQHGLGTVVKLGGIIFDWVGGHACDTPGWVIPRLGLKIQVKLFPSCCARPWNNLEASEYFSMYLVISDAIQGHGTI